MAEKKRKTYRNFTRSEKAIIRAYAELMQEKGDRRITVTDIVNTADLNRSTFYAHFKTADEVRERIHTDVISELKDMMSEGDYRNSLSDPMPALRHIVELIMKDEEMYKRLLCTEGASKFLKGLEETVIENYLTDEVILPLIKDREEFEMYLRLVIGGFISVLQDWASDDIKMPLERVIEIMGYSIKRSAEIYLARV